jgi:hypothetical protein
MVGPRTRLSSLRRAEALSPLLRLTNFLGFVTNRTETGGHPAGSTARF